MRRIGRGADRLDGQHGSYYLNYNNLINKPTVGDGGLTQNNFTDADHTKLNGIATGAEVNVQSDWNASSGDALILNKPTIPTNNNQLTNGAGYVTTSGWTSGNDGSGSGLDADLLDGQHGSHYLNYNNLSNTPTIPTNNNQLTNGAGYVTSSGWTSSNDGSGSGLDADYLDGYHYDSRWLNGSSGTNHSVAANYSYNWFRPVNDTGLYLNTYGAHWYRTQSSYGTWQGHGYTLNGYVGLQTYYSYQKNLG